MRKCKYFYSETWVYPSKPPEYYRVVQCLGEFKLGFYPSKCREGIAKCYTPVEIDPYWKDIFDETNRRLHCLK